MPDLLDIQPPETISDRARLKQEAIDAENNRGFFGSLESMAHLQLPAMIGRQIGRLQFPPDPNWSLNQKDISSARELGIDEDWYRYRDTAFKQAAADFLEANDIPYVDDCDGKARNLGLGASKAD